MHLSEYESFSIIAVELKPCDLTNVLSLTERLHFPENLFEKQLNIKRQVLKGFQIRMSEKNIQEPM